MGFAEVAKRYYDMGFSIMPIQKGDKKPMLPWEKYQKERADVQQIEGWNSIYKDCNIAIITGSVSGNILVLDIDGDEGKESIKGKHLPPTLTARTGRGWHYYFRMRPNRTVRNAASILPKVDIRGEGGYVIAPGSVHSNGRPYEWVLEEEIAECPEWIEKQIEQSRIGATDAKKKRGRKSWIDKLKEGTGAGERNDACTRLAGYYLAKSYDPEDVISILQVWNKKNTPPLEEKEIKTIVASIANKEDGQRGARELTGIERLDIKSCKAIVSKWLYLKDDNIIDVVLSVVASTHHTGDPLWVVLVGPPSSGKTEILRGFNGHGNVYFIDRLTPSTFVTGFTKAKGILERMGPEPKTFILQDFSTILSKPPYDRMEIMDTMRQMYNGSYHNEWGNGKRFTWKGKVGMVAGATPDIESHHHSMAELGERFLYYRVESDDDETRTKMMQKARDMEGKEGEARTEIAKALQGVIESCSDQDITEIKMEKFYCDWLSGLVDLTTAMRSPVKRNYYRREVIEYTPHKEGPARMYKASQVLMKSLATVRGRSEVNEEDYAVVVKVCVDSIQSIRREALRALCRTCGQGGVRPKDVAQQTGYQSTESIGYHLADLAALGLVDRWIDKRSSSFNAPFLYEMKKKTYDKLDNCGMINLI